MTDVSAALAQLEEMAKGYELMGRIDGPELNVRIQLQVGPATLTVCVEGCATSVRQRADLLRKQARRDYRATPVSSRPRSTARSFSLATYREFLRDGEEDNAVEYLRLYGRVAPQ